MKTKPLNKFHSKPIKEVLKNLDSNVNGLSKEEAKKRLEKFGYNEIIEKKKTNLALVFLKQFNSFMIYILIVAALISFFIKHYIDVYVIIGVILINGIIGFIQEYRSEKAIKALKKMIVPHAKVYRDGELLEINAKELVFGDIILLEDGDKVPADARIIELKNFRTVESSLTGESFPVDKSLNILSEKTVLADCKNMVWMGSFVANGVAKAVVTGTGSNTAIGKIAVDIEKIKRVKGHFKEKTDRLAKQMGFIAFVGALLTFIIGYFIRGFEFTEIFLFTLASLVSGIPEGLPAVLIIVLAIGARRMSKRNAIVRNLPATETLGVVNAIITDKTGTLTENTMNVEKIMLPYEDEIIVSGEGWKPSGKFYQNNNEIKVKDNLQLLKILSISSVCNNARVFKKEKDYEIIGDPTEAALLVLSKKINVKENIKKLDDLPFNPELKYRASLSALENNKKEIYVVGAPEVVLNNSKYFLKKNIHENLKNKKEILNQIEILTKKSMRVLALAYKEVPEDLNYLTESSVNNLIFVGLVGIRDPPREGVKEAIAKAKKAGIKIIMATGDHKGTAIAIAKEIGLIDKDEGYTEEELLKLSNNKFKDVVKNCSVFARLTPGMKLKIAEVLQKKGYVVAMTGDGVNDAPALKKADIGIAMGVIGTDVARESSEIILADDNFASIINAIEEGRIVFRNTKQASSFLVTTNFAEDITIISILALGMPLPLLPTQILLLNLVTDGVPGGALAAEPGHGDVLDEKPRKAKENILSKDILPFLILMSFIMIASTIFIFTSYLPSGLEKARTGAFVVMSFTQLFNVLNMRSLKKSVFKIGLFSNKYVIWALLASIIFLVIAIYVPFFQNLFKFVGLSLSEFLIIMLISSLVLIFGEVYKFVRKKFYK